MIHITRGDDPHEWLTDEEYQMQYPELYEQMHRPRPYAEVGAALRRNRVDKDLTTREVAKITGWKMSFISGLETGSIEPTDELITAFHKAIGVIIMNDDFVVECQNENCSWAGLFSECLPLKGKYWCPECGNDVEPISEIW